MGSLIGTGFGTRSTEKPLAEQLEMYELIFNAIYNGCMVTDEEGYITHFNRPYGEFLHLNPEEQIGRHCTEVIENTRMHLVARTGKAEINESHRIRGQDMVVQRIPIRKNGAVVGVFGQVMFKDVRDVKKLADNLKVLESKVELYEKELISLRSTKYTLDSIIGVSSAIRGLKQDAMQAASTHLPVLITGESGTGKELFAQAIHHASPRKIHPFIRINCASIPKDLLESELFGYDKGAFTGARTEGKPGKFELAKRGTVFLDEIGDLPLDMQPKLLRVLEEKEFERVGGTRLIKADFRLIAASNQDLEGMLEEGRFRKDLFYRLNVFPLHIPPVRERREDILPMARFMLSQISDDASLSEIILDVQAERAMMKYDWPGNGRELSNVLERVVSSLRGNTIHTCDLPFYLYRSRKQLPGEGGKSLKTIHDSAEREAIRYALESTNYNKSKAAALLGIHRTALYKKIKKYNLPLVVT